MTPKAGLFAPALVLCLATRWAAAAEAGVSIAVDATAPGAPLEPVWAYFGYDEANYTTTSDGRELLATLASSQAAPVRVRTHFLFNTGDGTPALKWGSTNIYTEDAGGNAIYDYSLIDAIVGATLDAGAVPLFELGFMPQALSTRPEPYRNSDAYTLDGGCFYPPESYEKWGALVGAWAAHVKERYPEAEARFQWELWNEPDLPYWQGSFEEFAELYDHTEAALHAVLPAASLGGPAVAGPSGAFLRNFLEHCATGTNAVTGRTGTRLDMVSFHAKGGVSAANGYVQMNLGAQLRLHRSGFQAVTSSAFATTPIVISEADPDGCAACPASDQPANAYRNSPAYGAYVVAMMKRSLDLALEEGADLRGVLTWAFTFPQTPYFAGYRALATNGIHLPVLNAFKLLGALSGDRLPVTSSGARALEAILSNSVRDDADIDALAVRDGERIQILVWNYHDDLVEAAPASVTLDVSIPPAFAGGALVTHTRVDHAHGDAHSAWVAQGSPASPSGAQLAELRAAMQPVILERERAAAARDGNLRLSFELPRFGLSLVTLSPAKPESSESAANDSSCSCRVHARRRTSWPALLGLMLVVALARRRRATS